VDIIFSFFFFFLIIKVVIEGVRGTGYVGDSAIDDVQLTKGEECLAALKRMMADTIVPGDP
jgi:molybdopterin-binding protein